MDARSLKVAPTDGEKDGSMHNGNSLGSSSLTVGSAVESSCSGTNFSESSRSCSSSTSYSRNISEVEDGGCVDDWEVLADELAATDPKKKKRGERFQSLVENNNVSQVLNHRPEEVKQPNAIVDVLKPKPENGQAGRCAYDYQSKHPR
nr:PREDICTED: uncharacterized protein LOC108221357 [Daucus carota subsp. sativus]